MIPIPLTAVGREARGFFVFARKFGVVMPTDSIQAHDSLSPCCHADEKKIEIHFR
jgi:hypothetical protein